MANGSEVGEATAGEAAAISRGLAYDIMSRRGEGGSPIAWEELPDTVRLNLSDADVARLKELGALSVGPVSAPEVGETTAADLVDLPSVSMGETYNAKRAQVMAQDTRPTDAQLLSLANLRTIWHKQLARESAQAGGSRVSQELSAGEAIAGDPTDSELMASMSDPFRPPEPPSLPAGLSRAEIYEARHRPRSPARLAQTTSPALLRASAALKASDLERAEADKPTSESEWAEKIAAAERVVAALKLSEAQKASEETARLMEEQSELYGSSARGEFTRRSPARPAGRYQESKTRE